MRSASILICLTYTLWTSFAYAQADREIEVKVLDPVGRPIADAHVIARASSEIAVAEDSMFDPPRQPSKIVGRAITDSSGAAKIKISPREGDNDATAASDSENVIVTAWKSGFGPASATARHRAELRCSPNQLRQLQVLDANGKPKPGLRVSRDNLARETDLFDPPWWSSTEATTDEFGLASVEVPGGANYMSIMITEEDGTVHRLFTNDVTSRLSGRETDPRDLTITYLSRHGKLTGKMPAEFAADYNVLLRKDTRSPLTSVAESRTSVSSEVQLDPDGTFRFDAIEEGDYWLVVHRKTLFDPASPPTRQPISVQPVKVEAGQTTNVTIGTVALAKVSGRFVASDSSADLSGMRLTFSQSVASLQDPRSGQAHSLVRVVSATDGSYVTWLPPGKYVLLFSQRKGWRASSIPEFEVGNGAASATVNDIRLAPTKSFNVSWLESKPSTNSLQSFLTSRLVFQLKDKSRVDCALTADGYGKVEIPVGTEVERITNDGYIVGEATESAFVDRDETENFQLEMIRTPQGRSTNIGIKGRVVDANNQPTAGLPVTVTLSFAPLASADGQVNFAPTNLGSQSIDVVVSQLDGSYSVSPRQLLRRLTIPNRESENECRLIFTASTPANPEPIEVRKVLKLKLSDWKETEVEFPDLVIDRPVGGNRLVGKLLDVQGKPSAGELVRIGDKRRLVRRLTDRDGNFEVDDLAGTTWLLRQSDWSIHAIDDYSEPKTFAAKVSASPVALPRLDSAQRQTLVKELLQNAPSSQPINLSDEAFLDRSKYLTETLLKGVGSYDDQRVSYANFFWPDMSDEQLEQLNAVTVKPYNKSIMLRILAERHPSREAYERVMKVIDVPEGKDPYLERIVTQTAEIALKLHTYGALEPHRFKLKQMLDVWTEQKNRERAQFRQPPNLPRMALMEPDAIVLGRALLDVDAFAENMAEQLQMEMNELSPEDRSMQLRSLATFIRIFPAEQFKLPSDRQIGSLQAWLDLGAQNPMLAVQAARQGKMATDALRIAVQSALNSGHPDARQAFLESLPMNFRTDSLTSRIMTTVMGPAGPFEINWYKAAKNVSDELAPMAAWVLAYDYLSGRYEENAASVLQIYDRKTSSMLAVAYCLSNEYPALAKQIADRCVPRMLNQVELDYDLPFSRTSDVSLVAYIAPAATTELVIKLHERYAADLKNQPAGQQNRLYSKRSSVATLKASCLRGLLLERF